MANVVSYAYALWLDDGPALLTTGKLVLEAESLVKGSIDSVQNARDKTDGTIRLYV